MQLANGHKLQDGKYRIENKIGQGGFGITYRAFWKTTVQGAIGAIDAEIPAVIKEFFWKDYCTREEGTSVVSISSTAGKEMFAQFKEKLKKEAEILSRFKHPNIVRVLDIFEENNTAYMVMQLVEGESLKDKIERLGKLDEATALKYTGQLCSALAEVHDKRILHLDVKPGNVVIDKNDNAQLIDFGISKQYNDNKQETSTTPIGISKGYAPIEQYSGIEKFNPPTDIYSLGATLYTMLTGQIPLEATLLAMEDLEPVQKFNPKVSALTAAVIAKAMEIKPAKRFQTIQEFWDAIGNGDVFQNSNAFQNVAETIIDTQGNEKKEIQSNETKIDTNHAKLKEQQPITSPVVYTSHSIIEPEMVFVQGGVFTMGCTPKESSDYYYEDEKPAHQVTLSSFYIGKYEVTQKQWQLIMGTSVRQQRNKAGISLAIYGEGDNYPMYYVSWNEAQEFIRRLNEATGKQYRLATEAEWEYAARGGNKSQGYKYSGGYLLNDVAWYTDNSGNATHPVGAKRPNELGIYDMSGNVWEWCQDWYGTYPSSSQRDPMGSSSGSNRVIRGGGWGSDASYCRVSYRYYRTPDYRIINLGFRIACSSN